MVRVAAFVAVNSQQEGPGEQETQEAREAKVISLYEQALRSIQRQEAADAQVGQGTFGAAQTAAGLAGQRGKGSKAGTLLPAACSSHHLERSWPSLTSHALCGYICRARCAGCWRTHWCRLRARSRCGASSFCL